MLWVLVLGAILFWAPSPTITHRTAAERAHIKPKPCSVNGIDGTCMFVYECIKTDGKHIGMCVDNFMFGSCCSHNVKQNSILPHFTHQHNHHHNHHHHQSNSNALYSSSNIYSSPRPPNHILSGRPQSNKFRPSKPVGFVTNQTKKPASASHNHWLKDPLSFSSSSSAPATTSTTSTTSMTTAQKHLGALKPWTNRPTTFVTSADSSLKPYFPEGKFPISFDVVSTEVTQSLQSVSSNSSPANDVTSTSSVHFPTSKENTTFTSSWQSQTANTSMNSAATTITITTSSTTAAPPSTTTVKSSSSWTKPSWNGSPHPNNLHSPSKPWPQIFKPETLISEKPSFLTSQTAWTSEPHFVTRPRPQSNLWLKPKPTRKPIAHSGSLGMSSIRSNLTNGDINQLGMSSSSTLTSTTSRTALTTAAATTQAATNTSATVSTASAPSQMTTTTTGTTTTTAKTTGAATSGDSLETTTAFSKNSKYQYSGQCGVAALSPRPEMRIVGGKNAPFGGWPWQVSVRRTSFFGFSSTHRCGGAVINENWIATAGHCVDDLLTSQIRIRVGEYDFSSVQEPYPFVERGASKKVVHPKYNFFTYEYDLALVRLESSLEFQPHISPICLPASDDLLIGENATVTGWGRLSEGGTLPSVLQQVSVPIVSNDKCKSMFLRAGRHEFIPEIFLCAGYENGGQDSCQGDSGGPLQVKGKNGRYFLAGIISWGIGCAEANLPGVCTRISKFVPWILENVT